MGSNIDKLKGIMRDQQARMSSAPTLASTHRLPRINQGKSDFDNKFSGLPRTFMSSYNSGWDPLSEAEQSILVSKLPAQTRPQTPSEFSRKAHARQSTTRFNTDNQPSTGKQPRGVVPPGPGSGSSTSTIDIVEEETKTTTKTTTRTSTSALPPTRPFSSGNPPEDEIVSKILATRTADELDEVLRKLKLPQLMNACAGMLNHVRRNERQAELREELLRRSQTQISSRDRAIEERDAVITKLEKDLVKLKIEQDEDVPDNLKETKKRSPFTEDDISVVTWSSNAATLKCRFHIQGCPYRLPSMEDHEERECHYRPTRCPSLTCPAKPAFSSLLKHIEDEHDGTRRGRDRICRNSTNHLISSYVNIDKEPVFYKTSKMTWVANELVIDGQHHFFLECMRIPPDWHMWLYYLGGDSDAEKFQVTITLFREEEYGKIDEKKIFSAQRSYTGKVISIHRSKEEIAENGLGFMVHDKQIKPLCGNIAGGEEQLFGYEVTVYKK